MKFKSSFSPEMSFFGAFQRQAMGWLSKPHEAGADDDPADPDSFPAHPRMGNKVFLEASVL